MIVFVTSTERYYRYKFVTFLIIISFTDTVKWLENFTLTASGTGWFIKQLSGDGSWYPF